ncbi:hypothetical protein TNCV_2561111 [Trichonephila clavipes]|uniref:Uncharacterized protein n=1 Tax=Trichonephila clavipes TaxID=2585209 RepID=A0A8X6R6A9_TRICX|nr:hypothetical protein TNCV_2561111 [Trichonephila clavipes]
MWHQKIPDGPGSVFVCSARIGLRRLRAGFCGLPMIRDEWRVVDPPWCLKEVFRKRGETWTETRGDLKRGEEILEGRDQSRSDSESEGDFPEEKRYHEFRWRWRLYPNNVLEKWASALRTKQCCEVFDHP